MFFTSFELKTLHLVLSASNTVSGDSTACLFLSSAHLRLIRDFLFKFYGYMHSYICLFDWY